jgi:hypothetical protein
MFTANMPIPESQLETWSHQGAITTAKATADSVKRALDSYENWPEGVKYEVYLQGSYKNDTNIRGDSDVDVVAQLNSTFYSNLSDEQRGILRLTPASYGWANFKTDVLKALKGYYGESAVAEGNKSIKIKGGKGRLPADVVVCAKLRRYKTVSPRDYVEGMCFWSRNDHRKIVNYPKLHYENGVRKHSPERTNGWYKPTVRIFKNARTCLVDHGTISDDLAPSYFLECLLYNVPDNNFGGSFQDTLVAAFNWLWSAARADSLVCQNGQLKLFGYTPEQWDAAKAKQFLESFRELWENS